MLAALAVVFVPPLSRWMELMRRRAQHEQQTRQITADSARIQQEMTRLQHDKVYLERAARDRFKLARPGEEVIQIVEDKAPTD